jgi:hypothetical protein
MSRVLRKEIIEDKGSSKLKQKTLDLITNLRLEANLLDEKKKTKKIGQQSKPIN